MVHRWFNGPSVVHHRSEKFQLSINCSHVHPASIKGPSHPSRVHQWPIDGSMVHQLFITGSSSFNCPSIVHMSTQHLSRAQHILSIKEPSSVPFCVVRAGCSVLRFPLAVLHFKDVKAMSHISSDQKFPRHAATSLQGKRTTIISRVLETMDTCELTNFLLSACRQSYSS